MGPFCTNPLNENVFPLFLIIFFFFAFFSFAFSKLPNKSTTNENANNENVKADRLRRNLVHKKSAIVRSGNVIASALNEMPKVDNNNNNTDASIRIGPGIMVEKENKKSSLISKFNVN